MHRFAGPLWTAAMLSVLLITALPFASAGAGAKAKQLQIGMAKSFFFEKSKSFVEIAVDDFKKVMKETTGLDGDLISKFEATEVAQKVENKQLDFGIFHAVEFAWLQKKYPDFHPLMIAANKHPEERAFLIIRKDSPTKTIADLRGKKLDMPSGTTQHCRLFLEKHCTEKAQTNLSGFFGMIKKSPAPKEALDDLARNKSDAVIVDTNSLQHYKEIRGPVFENHLKVLQQSENFPPSVIVYKEGALDKAIVKQFRDGMVKAHTTELGRDMMKEWSVEAFEPIPKDYAKSLAEVLKAYPPR